MPVDDLQEAIGLTTSVSASVDENVPSENEITTEKQLNTEAPIPVSIENNTCILEKECDHGAVIKNSDFKGQLNDSDFSSSIASCNVPLESTRIGDETTVIPCTESVTSECDLPSNQKENNDKGRSLLSTSDDNDELGLPSLGIMVVDNNHKKESEINKKSLFDVASSSVQHSEKNVSKELEKPDQPSVRKKVPSDVSSNLPTQKYDREFHGEPQLKEKDEDESHEAYQRRNAGRLTPSGSGSPSPPPSEVMHKVKKIKFRGKDVPIITQNNNGPCPLLAILNALLLKGQVELGVSSNEVKGGHLVSVVGNALIDQSLPVAANQQMLPDIQHNTQDAVDNLDQMLTGLDVNVRFSGVQDFEYTKELCVFDVVRVNLYHGWVVDPEWPAAEVVQSLTYNQLTNNIIAWREEAQQKTDDIRLMKAVLSEEFLETTSSQLTVHGLFALGSTMEEGEVAVLFRNNHFSTILKQKDQLFQLLTDQGFLNEAAVWQTLSDVDASFSEFVTESFEPWQAQGPVPSYAPITKQQQVTNDEELATVLQQEDEEHLSSEANFALTLQKLGCDSSMTDEDIAKALQQEEDRAFAEAESARSAERRGEGDPRSPPNWGDAAWGARPSRSPSDQRFHPSKDPKKKKDQCCIL